MKPERLKEIKHIIRHTTDYEPFQEMLEETVVEIDRLTALLNYVIGVDWGDMETLEKSYEKNLQDIKEYEKYLQELLPKCPLCGQPMDKECKRCGKPICECGEKNNGNT